MLEKWRELRKKLDFGSNNLVAINIPRQNELLAKIEVAGDYSINNLSFMVYRLIYISN